MDKFIQYFDIPFVKSGRTKEGCDCYGFVRLVLKEQSNIELPTLDNIEAINPNYDHSLFKEVTDYKDYDLVLMKGSKGLSTHIGFIYQDKIIHMTEKGVTTNNLKALKRIIIGTYRYTN